MQSVQVRAVLNKQAADRAQTIVEQGALAHRDELVLRALLELDMSGESPVQDALL